MLHTTSKNNFSGQQQWVIRYDGPGHDLDRASGIAVNDSGNVYVTGWSWEAATSSDYATIKYDSAGQEQWVARYNSPGNGTDAATRIATDESGNVYVTGNSRDPSTNYEHYVTIKYNSAGQEQWVASYSGPYNGAQLPLGIAVDGSGNVYVTGQSTGSGFASDCATVKYNASGTEQWVARYDGPGGSEDSACGLVLDNSGNVYVTGTSVETGNNTDYATIKYLQGPPPTPTPTPTASPSPTPTATVPSSPTPTATGSPTTSPTPMETPTPTPTPKS